MKLSNSTQDNLFKSPYKLKQDETKIFQPRSLNYDKKHPKGDKNKVLESKTC